MAHKDPTDRAHIWQRGDPGTEADATAAQSTYRHELPRHVHKAGGESLIVRTPDECEAAFKTGWRLLPPKVAEPKAEPAPTPPDPPPAT